MFLQIIRFYSFRPRLLWHFWCSQVHSRTLGDLFLRPQTPAAAPSQALRVASVALARRREAPSSLHPPPPPPQQFWHPPTTLLWIRPCTDISDGKLMEEYSVFKKYFVKAAEEWGGIWVKPSINSMYNYQTLILWQRSSKPAPDYEGAGTQDHYGFNQRSNLWKLRLQDGSIPSPFH